MPLITDRGFAGSPWTRLADGEPLAANATHVIVPLERLAEALEAGIVPLGVAVANTVKPADLEPHLERLALISIAFPSFADGRGFSIAKALRNLGFSGELRAFGPLIADQFAHARGVGFDAIEVPDALAERQPAEHWAAALDSLSYAYQRGYQRGINILDQRRTARQRAKAA